MHEFYGEDDFDYCARRRHVSPGRFQPRDDFLGVEDSRLFRSRSTGQRPVPQINVINRVNQDQEGSPYPRPPYPYQRQASPRSSPEGRERGRSRLGDRLADAMEDEFVDMVKDNRRRSRSRSDVATFVRPQPGPAEWELARRDAASRERSREHAASMEAHYWKEKYKLEAVEEQRKRDKEEEEEKEREREWKRKQDALKTQWKYDALHERQKHDEEEEKRKEREKRIVSDYECKKREDDEKRKDAEKRAVEEFERKQREAKEKQKDEEQRILDRIEREKKEKKEKEERAYREFKEKEREEKEERERKWNDFLREQKEREEKKKKEDKEKEDKFQEEMRQRLSALGYTEETIDIMVDKEKAKKFKTDVEKKTTKTSFEIVERPPVYPKIHRTYLDLETLRYYSLPWKYDPNNSEYIIILKEIDKRQTDVLFEHTKKLRSRSGTLLIEGKKKEPQLAMFRRRSRSRAGGRKVELGVVRYD